ncbi:MAG: MOSC domain-containing protein [Acidimicrobiia bacterium]
MATVHQINTSKGGVPKLSVASALVGDRGIVGDEQADRVHHGHPEQALCLFSLEVIESMRAEGHPIAAGSAGENITVSGIDWDEVVPGREMTIGPVRIEITDYATPCSKNAQWFEGGRFNRMRADRYPGQSRVYARVLEGGPIATGDPVALTG